MNGSARGLRLAVPVYTATLLLSAFLLFLIQPMFGKMVLPILGGVPAVWITAMLFFQVAVLAGYCYAHGLARLLPIRTQATVHMLLVIPFLLFLPISLPDGLVAPAIENPAFWQLGVMLVTVGGPVFVLSASAPLLQNWFAHTGHKDADNPYFLYSASNLGSLTALIAYPFVVEPALTISSQSLWWAAGYCGFSLLIIGAALAPQGRRVAQNRSTTTEAGETVTWSRKLLWIVLAFAPSSLMLGVTTFITTDLASVPLLWVVPLALYIGSFVIAFARRAAPYAPMIRRVQFGVLLVLLVLQLLHPSSPILFQIIFHLLLFFMTALVCHQELVSARPTTQHLTQFYLFLSLGGALGGVFNAIIAPQIFLLPVEYAVILALAVFLRFSSDPETALSTALRNMRAGATPVPRLVWQVVQILIVAGVSVAAIYLEDNWWYLAPLVLVTIPILLMMSKRRWSLGVAALAILALHAPATFSTRYQPENVHFVDRNFFGLVRVVEREELNAMALTHGTTIHGSQSLAPIFKLIPMSYYSHRSPFDDAIKLLDDQGNSQAIAVLGLGVGTVACFPAEGRRFEFFEINPTIVRVAEDPALFTFLSDCGSDYSIDLGDARMEIARKPDASYDMIFLDVFSSDTIPIHTVTVEALDLYRKKLKRGGFIVVNISNRFMDLRPVLAAAANELDMTMLAKSSEREINQAARLFIYATEYAVLTDNEAQIRTLRANGWKPYEPDPSFRLWTDQYSDLLSVLKVLRD